MLDRGAQRVLDRAAVEAADRLELVERDDDLPPADLREARGQREHLLGEPGDVAFRSDVGKRDGQGAEGRPVRRDPHFGPGRPDDLAQPRARAIPSGLGGDERAGVAFEKRDVGAEAADGDLDGEGAAPRHRGERVADERRLAVAPGRDEEHLLPGGQVADEAVELDDAVDEGGGRDDLAVDEGVLHYVKCHNRYVL